MCAMSPKLLRPRATGFVSPDADARAYLAAVRAADGSNLEPAVSKAISDFVIGLKADGIWSAIKASCILAGARTLAGALVPLVGSAPTNNGPFVSGDYNRKTGLVGNATSKYLDANIAPTAMPLGSLHFSVFASTAEGTNFGAYVGSNSAAASDTAAIARANTALSFSNNATTARSVASAGTATGFIGNNRPSTVLIESRVSGATGSQSVGAVNRSPDNFFIYGTNTGSLSSAGNSRLAFYSIGESLNLALLDSRVSALITAIGAAIP